MVFLAGMGAYDLTEFGVWEGDGPRGWVEVSLAGVGGGEGGDVLRCMLVQLRVCENHQNGKDTHVRGLQVFARDERAGVVDGGGGGDPAGKVVVAPGVGERRGKGKRDVVGLDEPDWMREPELR